MRWKFLLLVALLLAASPPAAAQAPEELRCVYDGTPDDARDSIGRAAWDNLSVEVPNAMIPVGQACHRRYRWDQEHAELALRFAIGTSGIRYLRARLTQLGVAVDSWDAVYDAAPVAVRIGSSTEIDVSSLENAAMAAIASDPNARKDPNVVGHSAAYFGMRAVVERSELDWARLHPAR